MIRITKTASGLLAVLLLLGCNSTSDSTSAKTGFLSDTQGATPVSHQYDGMRPATAIQNPEDSVVLIYNHGTAKPREHEDCERPGNQVPSSLQQLQNDNLLIFYLCSEVVEESGDRTGDYIYKRMNEVERIVDELITAGTPPGNIFLTGHSAGGWTSLMAASYFPDKFNGAVVFAPAFAGPRHEEEQYPHWRGEALPRQIEDMLTAYERHALVFAYYDDVYERPQDLEFLINAYSHSIRMVAYECVGVSGHMTHMQDCREDETSAAVQDFIAERAEVNPW